MILSAHQDSDKKNKTSINTSRFIFNFCSRRDQLFKLHGQAELYKMNIQKYLNDLS